MRCYNNDDELLYEDECIDRPVVPIQPIIDEVNMLHISYQVGYIYYLHILKECQPPPPEIETDVNIAKAYQNLFSIVKY